MRLRSTTLAVILTAALLLASCTPATTGSGTGAGSSTSTPATATQSPPVTSGGASTASPFVTPAADVKRVVVKIDIEGSVSGARGLQAIGNGSGIVIRADGYILTNQHVVAAGSAVSARIGSETVPAKIVGQDASTDLAVVKVDRTGMTAATIGDPKALQVGDYVVAVGYPFDVGATVTHGIVSALGRSTLAPPSANPNPHGGTSTSSVAAYTDLIQTDAAINPGNSGGALATLDGAVVGVNTLIESGSGSSAGIGFAIPIDFAMNVADQLIKTGKAVHPFLGVLISTVVPGQSVSASEGALVQQVLPGGGAAKAGLKAGDVIVSLAGMPVTSVEDLYAALRQQKIGATIPVVVIRGGKRVTIQVTVGSDKK